MHRRVLLELYRLLARAPSLSLRVRRFPSSKKAGKTSTDAILSTEHRSYAAPRDEGSGETSIRALYHVELQECHRRTSFNTGFPSSTRTLFSCNNVITRSYMFTDAYEQWGVIITFSSVKSSWPSGRGSGSVTLWTKGRMSRRFYGGSEEDERVSERNCDALEGSAANRQRSRFSRLLRCVLDGVDEEAGVDRVAAPAVDEQGVVLRE